MQEQPIKAFVFDAYGTLLDVHSAVGKSRNDLGDKADDISNIWRTKQLEYTWLRSLMGKHCDFWQVTSDALTYALRCHDMENNQRHDRLMAHYLELTAYQDALDTVKYLRSLGYPTLILSNGVERQPLCPVASTTLAAFDAAVI
ncbi:HAD-IA family hydrolase [Kiloniella sp.]|uniref:HAD-IA family hydrolase n=1 Tax=Kiloniella sp. TaxID=1938587 RepID=UPI003B013822